jgi:hypothetical protein
VDKFGIIWGKKTAGNEDLEAVWEVVVLLSLIPYLIRN